MLSTSTVILLLLYCLFLGLVVYISFFADPETSAFARFVTETLPQKAWKILETCCSPRALYVIEFFGERLLIVFYCVIVFGSWSIIFNYCYSWLDRQTYMPFYHRYIGYCVFGSCVLSWRVAVSSSPGRITAASMPRYDHYPYDNLMFAENAIDKKTKLRKLARSKYCRFKYNCYVPRFDHFCGWVHNTIGQENYRWFLLFLLVHVLMCCYGTYAVGGLFYGEVLEKELLGAVFFDKFTGREIPSTYTIVSQYLFSQHTVESAVLVLMAVMSLALGLFLLYHVWLTSRGLTTNESYKWDQIQRWYNRELKRYNQAVKRGEAVVETETNSSSGPTVTDGDVTCTPGINNPIPNENEKEYDDSAVQHPGPRPVNIYNRGFVENWKEVLFPISLRKQEDGKVKAT